jgi:hypothetical protein
MSLRWLCWRSFGCLSILLGGFAGECLEYSYHHQEETCRSEGVYDDVVEDDRTLESHSSQQSQEVRILEQADDEF